MKNSNYLVVLVLLIFGFKGNNVNAQFNFVSPTTITGTAPLFTGTSVPSDAIVDPIITPGIDPTATTVSSYSDGSGFNNVYIWNLTANVITMGFAIPVDITGVAIWNAFASGAYADPGFLEPNHSVALANFEFFSGGVSLGNENINVLFPDDAFGELYPFLGNYDDVDVVVMTVLTNHGGNETAMQEIAFNTFALCDDITTDISATEICLGDELTLEGTSTNGGTISWDGGAINGVPFVPGTVGDITYTASSTSPLDCEFSVVITVNDIPLVTASVDDTEICLGESVIFTGGGADTYVWDLGVTDGTAFTPIAAGTTTHTVTGTNLATGCENTASIDLTVNDLPAVTANLDDTEICLGESVIFTGGGADTYVWDLGITDGTTFTPIASGTTTHTVIGTNLATGCENTASVDLIVNDVPVVTANLDDTEICLGESVIFTGGGADTYVWDLGIMDGVVFTPIASGTTTHTVIGTNLATGCENTASIDLTVNDVPVVTANLDDTEICLGESVIFTGGGADTYVWDLGVTDGSAFTPITSGTITHTVTGTNLATGCQNTASIILSVNDVPLVTANVDDIEICLGESVTFTGGGADTYAWDLGVTDGIPYTPATAGTTTYTVTGTNAGGTACSATAEITVTVHLLPNVVFSADKTQICNPSTVTFTSLNPGLLFDWNFGDGAISSGNPVSHTYTNPGLYDVTLTVTSIEGCENSATYSDYIESQAAPIASFTYSPSQIDVSDTEVSFTNTTTGAISYEWNFNDGSSTSTETNPIHHFPELGNVQYEIELVAMSSFGCESTYTQRIKIEEIILYYIPNTFTPDGDSFNDSFLPVFTSGLDVYDYHLMIFNRWGEMVFESFNAAYGWDGTYGNRDIVQDGTYIWRLEFGETMSDKKHTIDGHVTLIK